MTIEVYTCLSQTFIYSHGNTIRSTWHHRWRIQTTFCGSKHQWIYLHKRTQTCISPCSAFMDPFSADYVPHGGINMTRYTRLYNSLRELLNKCRQCRGPREMLYVINTYIKNAVALYGCWKYLCNNISYSDIRHGHKKSFIQPECQKNIITGVREIHRMPRQEGTVLK